jgi:hypothetical protein
LFYACRLPKTEVTFGRHALGNRPDRRDNTRRTAGRFAP